MNNENTLWHLMDARKYYSARPHTRTDQKVTESAVDCLQRLHKVVLVRLLVQLLRVPVVAEGTHRSTTHELGVLRVHARAGGLLEPRLEAIDDEAHAKDEVHYARRR